MYVFGKENLGFLIDVRKVHVHEYAVMTYANIMPL
jgi:hypothetical protein